MASFLRHVPALLVSLFALLSLIFSIVGIVSKEWVIRHNYNTRLNIEDWKEPLYTLYRSPFLICSARLVNASNATTFASECERWKPFGAGRTSCESANATGNDTAPNVGDARLCQQIHFAGNFAIASTTFVGLATLLAIIMTVLLLTRTIPSGDETESTPLHSRQSKRHVSEQTHQVGSSSPTPASTSQSRAIVIGSYVSYFMLACFGIAVITAVIAQLYAILGLTMSLPNNSDFSSSAVGNLDDVNTQGSHGPWYQGKALSTYWTLGWGFALASGVLASRVWTLPRWN